MKNADLGNGERSFLFLFYFILFYFTEGRWGGNFWCNGMLVLRLGIWVDFFRFGGLGGFKSDVRAATMVSGRIYHLS